MSSSRRPEAHVQLGLGIYTRAEAARLLNMTPSRLRRWVNGYTYWLPAPGFSKAKRRRPPVINTDLPIIDDTVALSFLELMELRMVKAILDSGPISLQHLRAAAEVARGRFGTDHPFASLRVFTDGKAIFSAVSDDDAPDVVRWSQRDIDQVIAGPIYEQFLKEIDYETVGKQKLASRWWPMGRLYPIMLDPRVSFGAPVIAGTAVRTSVLARMAKHHAAKSAAVAFEVQLEQAEAAVEFERMLAAA